MRLAGKVYLLTSDTYKTCANKKHITINKIEPTNSTNKIRDLHMSIPGIAEQITLDSGEAELASITPSKENLKKVTLELVQQNKLHKTQRQVRVFDHKTLYIKEMIGKQARHILLDIALLNEKPVRIRDFNMAMLIASIVVSIIAVIAIYVESKNLINVPAIALYAIAGVLALTSVACFILTAKSYKDTWVFKTNHGRVPVLYLFNNAPNKAMFLQFTKALMNNIELARANSKLSNSKFLPAIVGEHRRLFEKQFITQEQFDMAKKNILSNNN